MNTRILSALAMCSLTISAHACRINWFDEKNFVTTTPKEHAGDCATINTPCGSHLSVASQQDNNQQKLFVFAAAKQALIKAVNK